MKQIMTTIVAFFLMQCMLFAQKVRVYDGDGLNIKFEYDSDSKKLYDIMFTGKDSNGKLIWKKTQLIDITEAKYENKPGYKYQLKDAGNITYTLVYNTSMERIKISKLDNSGNTVSSWLTYERKTVENKTSNLTNLSYSGPLKIKFTLDKKSDMISNVQCYYDNANAYRTLETEENDGGMGGEMYYVGTYRDHKYMIVYKPKEMKTVVVTVYYDSKTSKEFKLNLQTK